jgi:hypothetical protein
MTDLPESLQSKLDRRGEWLGSPERCTQHVERAFQKGRWIDLPESPGEMPHTCGDSAEPPIHSMEPVPRAFGKVEE